MMMKKTTSALAVAALLGTGFAITGVGTASAATFQVNEDTTLSISGRVYGWYTDTNNDSGEKKSSYGDASRFVFSGSHALDNGLSGFVNYEVRPKAGLSNTGTAAAGEQTVISNKVSDPVQIETRTARLGVRGDFGSVSFGRQAPLYDAYIDGLTNYQDVMVPTNASVTTNRRIANYMSPSINGFSFGVESQVNGDADKSDRNDNTSSFAVMGQYDLGMATLTAVYDDAETVAGNTDEDPIYGLAASFTVSNVGVSVVYQSDEATGSNTETELTSLNLSTSYAMGGLQLSVQNVDETNAESRTEVIGRASYDMANNFYLFTEYGVFDKAEDEGDGFAIGANYNF